MQLTSISFPEYVLPFTQPACAGRERISRVTMRPRELARYSPRHARRSSEAIGHLRHNNAHLALPVMSRRRSIFPRVDPWVGSWPHARCDLDSSVWFASVRGEVGAVGS